MKEEKSTILSELQQDTAMIARKEFKEDIAIRAITIYRDLLVEILNVRRFDFVRLAYMKVV